MTLGEAKGLLAIAGRNYNHPIPQGLAEDWAVAMGDIPESLGITALRAHIASSKYFPTIADMRALAELFAPKKLYLPARVEDPVPPEEIREVVQATLAKLRGGNS